jgi:hypothetical protein
MKAILATVLVLFLVPGLAAAQNGSFSPSRYEVRGSGGWIGFADDSLINHALAAASVRIRLKKGLGVEPELSYLVGPGEDRDIVFMPVVSYESGHGALVCLARNPGRTVLPPAIQSWRGLSFLKATSRSRVCRTIREGGQRGFRPRRALLPTESRAVVHL